MHSCVHYSRSCIGWLLDYPGLELVGWLITYVCIYMYMCKDIKVNTVVLNLLSIHALMCLLFSGFVLVVWFQYISV